MFLRNKEKYVTQILCDTSVTQSQYYIWHNESITIVAKCKNVSKL